MNNQPIENHYETEGSLFFRHRHCKDGHKKEILNQQFQEKRNRRKVLQEIKSLRCDFDNIDRKVDIFSMEQHDKPEHRDAEERLKSSKP